MGGETQAHHTQAHHTQAHHTQAHHTQAVMARIEQLPLSCTFQI